MKLIITILFASLIFETSYGQISQMETPERVESMPKFPGGEDVMMSFIRKNINIPWYNFENIHGIQGTVYTTFVVDSTGKVTNVKLLKGLDYAPEYNKEAIRVVNLFPNWEPGRINGKPVSVQYNLPIKFKSTNADNPRFSVSEAKAGRPEQLIAELKEEYKDYIPPKTEAIIPTKTIAPKTIHNEYGTSGIGTIYGTATYYDNEGKYYKNQKWDFEIKQYFFQASYATGLFKNRIQLNYEAKSTETKLFANTRASIGIAEENDLLYVEISYYTNKYGELKKTAKVLKNKIPEISKGHYLLTVSGVDDNFKLTIDLIKENGVFKKFEAVTLDYGLNEANSFKMTVGLSTIKPQILE